MPTKTIEELLQEYVDHKESTLWAIFNELPPLMTLYPVKAWSWPGYPCSTAKRVNRLIEDAPLEIALLSPSEYVREYRKWYEQNN